MLFRIISVRLSVAFPSSPIAPSSNFLLYRFHYMLSPLVRSKFLSFFSIALPFISSSSPSLSVVPFSSSSIPLLFVPPPLCQKPSLSLALSVPLYIFSSNYFTIFSFTLFKIAFLLKLSSLSLLYSSFTANILGSYFPCHFLLIYCVLPS